MTKEIKAEISRCEARNETPFTICDEFGRDHLQNKNQVRNCLAQLRKRAKNFTYDDLMNVCTCNAPPQGHHDFFVVKWRTVPAVNQIDVVFACGVCEQLNRIEDEYMNQSRIDEIRYQTYFN